MATCSRHDGAFQIPRAHVALCGSGTASHSALTQVRKFRPEFDGVGGIGIALEAGMHMSTSSPRTNLLPPSLDMNDGRVVLFQLDDPETNEGWQTFSLPDGGYLFEMRTAHGERISEHHRSFASISARLDRWYCERTLGDVA